MGKAQVSKRGEIYCPIKDMDIEPEYICFSKDGKCGYFVSLEGDTMECNHPDFENCNPDSEINL